MYGLFTLKDFKVPAPIPYDPAPDRIIYEQFKVLREGIREINGYTINCCNVCLNPVLVYQFKGKRVEIELHVAAFGDRHFSFKYHYWVDGSDAGCGGRSGPASYREEPEEINLEDALNKRFNDIIEYFSKDRISSKGIAAAVQDDLEKVRADYKELFIHSRQMMLF